MQHPAVVVIGGGGDIGTTVRQHLPEGAPVIAADSGVDGALALGLAVDVVVGDLDSATPEGLAAVEAAGARIDRHPVDKDATDLALALELARTLVRDDGEIVVVGVEGGRLDHLLAGILALADPALGRVRAFLGGATVQVVHGPGEVSVDAPVGHLVTLVPVGGVAGGVRTSGLRFPLRGEPLPAGTTRGVSNVVDADGATVSLDTGTLLVLVPGEAA
jgi:thiamine pyrophosphokinase